MHVYYSTICYTLMYFCMEILKPNVLYVKGNPVNKVVHYPFWFAQKRRVIEQTGIDLIHF